VITIKLWKNSTLRAFFSLNFVKDFTITVLIFFKIITMTLPPPPLLKSFRLFQKSGFFLRKNLLRGVGEKYPKSLKNLPSVVQFYILGPGMGVG